MEELDRTPRLLTLGTLFNQDLRIKWPLLVCRVLRPNPNAILSGLLIFELRSISRVSKASELTGLSTAMA